MSAGEGLNFVRCDTDFVTSPAGNNPFNNQQWMLKQFFPIELVDVFKDGYIQQSKFIFQGKKNHNPAAAGWRPVGPNHIAGSPDPGSLSQILYIAAGDKFLLAQAGPEKVHNMG